MTFAFTASLSPTLQRNCSRHRVKNLEKTKLKKVILTLFTCSVRILAGHCGTTRVICVFHAPFTFPTSKRPGKRKNSETNLDQHGCVLGPLAMSRLRLHRLRFGNTRHTNGPPLLHCRFESLAVVLQLSLDFRTLFRLTRRQIAGCAGAGYLPRPWHRICEPVRIPRYSYASGQDGFHRPGCCG